MNITELPPEIQERVLWYLDGLSLARAQLVCRTWQEIIEKLKNVKSLWHACCRQEIMPDVITEMLGNRALQDIVDNGCTEVDWEKLYQRWLFTSRIGRWKQEDNIVPTERIAPITCIKLTGSCVVTGHRNGDIHLWSSTSGEHLVLLGHHNAMVLDMVLLDLKREGPYFTKEVVDHQLVVSGGKDHVIQINPVVTTECEWFDKTHPFPLALVLQHHSDSIEAVRVYGNTLLASCADNTISLWTLKAASDEFWWPPQVELQRILFGPGMWLRWVGFWRNQVISLCHDAKVWSFDLQAGEEWTPKVLEQFITEGDDDTTNMEMIITNCFIFRESIVIFLTVDRHICISVDGRCFRAYPTFMALQSFVVAVALVGNLLAIGTESGAVFVYYFRVKKDLLNLDLSQPTWSSHVSRASILSIDIRESENGPQIAVATNDSLCITRWIHPRKVQTEDRGLRPLS